MGGPSLVFPGKESHDGVFGAFESHVERHYLKMVRLVGVEPTTIGFEDRCSNPLSYRRLRISL